MRSHARHCRSVIELATLALLVVTWLCVVFAISVHVRSFGRIYGVAERRAASSGKHHAAAAAAGKVKRFETKYW